MRVTRSMDKDSTARAATARGVASGAAIGVFAGTLFASETLYINPLIVGARNFLSFFLFFPALYGVFGAAAGLAGGVVSHFIARHRGGSAVRFASFVRIWFVAFTFFFAEGFGRCYGCHQWYRTIWPSLTITPIESFGCFLTVLSASLLAGAAAAALIRLLLRRCVAAAGNPERRAVTLAALFLLVLVMIPALRSRPEFTPPSYRPEYASTEGSKVRLVIVDGGDWDFIDPLLDTDKLPNLAALIDRGVRGDLGIDMPCISPYLWTCIATGVCDDVHGLCEFYGYRPPGATRPITRYPGDGNSKRFLFHRLDRTLSRLGVGSVIYPSSRQKTVPVLWDYLGDAGRSVCVAGYRYTWPPGEVNGALVTTKLGAEKRWSPTTWPPDLEDRLRSDFHDDAGAVTAKLLGERLAGTPPERLGAHKVKVEKARYEMNRDFKMTAAARALVDSLDPDFALLGLTGVDASEHIYLLEYMLGHEPNRPPLSGYFSRFTDEKAINDMKETIPKVYAVFDSLLGVITNDATDDEMVMVVSDHGHDLDGSGHRFGPEGILVMAGGPVKRGATIDSATVFDVLPTVLHVLGVPVPIGIRGRVLTEVFREESLERNEVRFISPDNGGEKVFNGGDDLPELDDEELRKLKALGYID